MTDTQFWRELDRIARKGMSEEAVQEFADMLMYGYKNDLNVCEIGLVNQYDKGLVNQLYAGDFNERLMLCSTTFEKGKRSVLNMEKTGEFGLPDGTEVCVVAIPCKFMLDNLYYKEQICGFAFNKGLNDLFVVPASYLRPMIERTGLAELPENYMPADEDQYREEQYRTYKSRFEKKKSEMKKMSIREWAVKKSPPAYLVILLNGKLDDINSEEYVAKIFCSQWKNVKKHVEKQNTKTGKKPLDEFQIEHKDTDVAEELSTEFINILYGIDMALYNTRHYAELVDYCKDMLELFENSNEDSSSWLGLMGQAMWELNPTEAEAFFKEHLLERDDTIMGYYSYRLLNAERWDDATEALKGYEDSEDETIQERLQWLKNRSI